jgi:dihydroorotate dehydrogenase (NAD+) catalytic subunit
MSSAAFPVRRSNLSPCAWSGRWPRGKIPVIGIGGIGTAEDAIEFLLAGATAVQVGTANFYNPAAAEQIIAGIEDYLRQQGESSVRAIIGSLRLGS